LQVEPEARHWQEGKNGTGTSDMQNSRITHGYSRRKMANGRTDTGGEDEYLSAGDEYGRCQSAVLTERGPAVGGTHRRQTGLDNNPHASCMETKDVAGRIKY